MNQLNVQFFASLREQLGRDTLQVNWPQADTVAALIEVVEQAADAKGALQSPDILVAVNQTMVDRDASVQPGDEVAFLPPVTGG
ncbi:MAG: molybdopterin converting factor subunit 1 [Pseudomonadales bacterium]